MLIGVKGRRRKPLLRLGSYKPMTFRSWVVDERICREIAKTADTKIWQDNRVVCGNGGGLCPLQRAERGGAAEGS